MSIKPATMEFRIRLADAGLYRGLSRVATVSSKLMITGLVAWASGLGAVVTA